MTKAQYIAVRLSPVLPRAARLEYVFWLSVYLQLHKMPSQTAKDFAYMVRSSLKSTKDLVPEVLKLVHGYVERMSDDELKAAAHEWYDNNPTRKNPH